MFEVEVCQSRQVVLVRFRGELSEDDFAKLDKLAAEARGKAEYDCIYDMTDVQKVSLRIDFVAKRADFPQPYKNRERIYVVQQDELEFLVNSYVAAQAAKGWKEPRLVRTLRQALDILAVSASDFVPLPSQHPVGSC